VDIKISTFIFKAAPEPVLAVYDFVMTTFVPGPAPNQQQQQVAPVTDGKVLLGQGVDPTPAAVAQQQTAQKIRVLVNLASVQGIRSAGVPLCIIDTGV